MAEANLYHDVQTFSLADIQPEVNHINNLYRRDYQQWLRVTGRDGQEESQRFVWEEATIRYGYFISSHSALGHALLAWANHPTDMEEYSYLLGAFASENNYTNDYQYARIVLNNLPKDRGLDVQKNTLNELVAALPDGVTLPERSVNLQLHTDSQGNIYIGTNKKIDARRLVKRLLGSTVPDRDPAEVLQLHEQGDYPGGWDFIQPTHDMADMFTPAYDEELSRLYTRILAMSYPSVKLPHGTPHVIYANSKLFHVLSYWFAKNGQPVSPEEIVAMIKENTGGSLPVETDGTNLIVLGELEDGSLSPQQFDQLIGGDGNCEITHLFLQRYGDLLNYTGRGNQHVSVDSLLTFIEPLPPITVKGKTVYPKKLSVDNSLYQKILQHLTQHSDRPVGRADLLTSLLHRGFQPHQDEDGGLIFDNLQPQSPTLTSLTLLDQLCGGNGEGISAQEIATLGEQDHSLWQHSDELTQPQQEINQPVTQEPVVNEQQEQKPTEDETQGKPEEVSKEPDSDTLSQQEEDAVTPVIVDSSPEKNSSDWLAQLIAREQAHDTLSSDKKTALLRKEVTPRQKELLYAAYQKRMITHSQAQAISNAYEAHLVLNNLSDTYGKEFIPKFYLTKEEEEREQQKRKGMSR